MYPAILIWLATAGGAMSPDSPAVIKVRLTDEQQADLDLVLAAVASTRAAVERGRADFLSLVDGVEEARGEIAWGKEGTWIRSELRVAESVVREGRLVAEGDRWAKPQESWEQKDRRLSYSPESRSLFDTRRLFKLYAPELMVVPEQLWFRMEAPTTAGRAHDWERVLDPTVPFGIRKTVSFDVSKESDRITISRKFDSGFSVSAVASREAGWNVVGYVSSSGPETAQSLMEAEYRWVERGATHVIESIEIVASRERRDSGSTSMTREIRYTDLELGPSRGRWPPALASYDLPNGTKVTQIGPGEGVIATKVIGPSGRQDAMSEERLRALGESLRSDGYASPR